MMPLLVEQPNDFQRHQEDDYVDFYTERNIPRMLSREGPRAAVGDVNSDGLDDVYIGGALHQAGHLYLQLKNKKFVESPQAAFKINLNHEQTACLFFDCDNDGDLDLFVGAGGNNKPPRSTDLEHQLFTNDGHGNFSLVTSSFPPNESNVGAAVAIDFDGDKDQDLFVAGRSISFLYGVTPKSYFFVNDGRGHFTEMQASEKDANKLGMVTGAVAADIAGDEKDELVIVGEWMSPRVFRFEDSKMHEVKSSLSNLNGWWQTVAAVDLDGDYKKDLVLGNVGENFYLRPDTLKPIKLWINYFGFDGSIQQFMTKTLDGRDVPVFMKRSMEEQFVYLRKENLKFTSYATKSVEELFGKNMTKEAVKKKFDFCSSVIAWNEGEARFSVEKLPPFVQFSSVNSVAVSDVNRDGKLDIITGGNILDLTPQFGRLDANFGCVMISEGKRKFKLLSAQESGLNIIGQVRDIKLLHDGSKNYFLFLRNDDYPVVYKTDLTTAK